VDEELIRLADRMFDTSDFFRRYMAGFVISTHENSVSHCGTTYVRNISNTMENLDTKDLMCLMLGFTPIVESNSLLTDTEFRQSIISNLSRTDQCYSNAVMRTNQQLSYADTVSCLFFGDLTEAYSINSTVKYPYCNNISLSGTFEVLVDQMDTYNATNVSGSFRVDGAVRQFSDSSNANNNLVGRQYAPLAEITGATVFYNNQVCAYTYQLLV